MICSLRIFILIAFAGFILPSSVRASLIVSYDTTGLVGNEASLVGVTTDPGIAALDLTRGSDLNTASGANTFSSSGWESVAASPVSSDNEYFSFGFTVDSITSVNLTTLQITTRSSSTGPGTLGLFWSEDSFASSLFTFDQAGTPSNTGDLASTIDLTGLSPVINDSIEFRIIQIGNTASGGGSTGSTGTFRLSNFNGSTPITLSGNIAVIPEPGSTLSLLAFLVAGTLRRKRRLLIKSEVPAR